MNGLLKQPALAEAFAKSGIAPLPGTIDSFGAFLRDEMSRYATVIRKAGIKQN